MTRSLTSATPTSPSAVTSGAGPAGGAPADGARRHGRPEALANRAWESVLEAHAQVMRRLAATDLWREVSLREYDVLYALSKCPEPVRQGELERYVLLSQPAISRLVDRLVTRGLVSKLPDPADGRGVRLALTDDGRAAQRRIGARHARDVARALTSRLTRDEIAALDRLAGKLGEPD